MRIYSSHCASFLGFQHPWLSPSISLMASNDDCISYGRNCNCKTTTFYGYTHINLNFYVFFSIILRVAGVSLAWKTTSRSSNICVIRDICVTKEKPTARSSNICVIRDICVTKALQELLRVEEPLVSLRRRVELPLEVVDPPLREVRHSMLSTQHPFPKRQDFNGAELIVDGVRLVVGHYNAAIAGQDFGQLLQGIDLTVKGRLCLSDTV